MSDETKIVLRGGKNAGIIRSLCELFSLPINEAIDMFYRSATALMIESGVSDLHCRSDKYLATLVMEETKEKGLLDKQ